MALTLPKANMPKCCSLCPCAHFPERTMDNRYCQAMYYIYHRYYYLIGFEYFNERAPWCPLLYYEEIDK